MDAPLVIVSGGQTGADRAALDLARSLGVPHGGWCPAGRLAEDGVIDAAYQLVETESSDPAQRTRRNVEDSDGTVVFSIAPRLSGGSKLTLDHARRRGKPCLHLVHGPDLLALAQRLRDFVGEHGIERLNVAGPRRSGAAGIEGFVTDVLREAFAPGTTRVGFWALPAARDGRVLRPVIEDLARRFEAPSFPPHLTLHVGYYDGGALRGALDAAGSSGPMTLDVQGVDTALTLSRTLFLRFAPLPALTRLAAAVASPGRGAVYRFDPHLSLLYQHLEAALARRLAAETASPLGQVSFDAVRAIRLPSAAMSLEHVPRWEELGSVELGGPSGRPA